VATTVWHVPDLVRRLKLQVGTQPMSEMSEIRVTTGDQSMDESSSMEPREWAHMRLLYSLPIHGAAGKVQQASNVQNHTFQQAGRCYKMVLCTSPCQLNLATSAGFWGINCQNVAAISLDHDVVDD